MISDNYLPILKPACENFLRNSTLTNIQELQKIINGLDANYLNNIQAYILVPLILKVDKLNSKYKFEETKITLLITIRELLLKIYLKEEQALKTIIVIVLKQIYDFEKNEIISNLSDEFKIAVLECLKTTFERTSVEILEQFYKKENNSLIGKVIIICVEVIHNEKFRHLRNLGIECLSTLFYVHKSADFNDIILRQKVADVGFIFLPKIIQTLFDVITGDDKQGSLLFLSSIKCLRNILCIIFEDYEKDTKSIREYSVKDIVNIVKCNNNSKVNDDEVLGMDAKYPEEKYKKLQSLKRNMTWLQASSRKIQPIFISLKTLCASPSDSIRKEYAIMCSSLLTKCSESMLDNHEVFFENIIALTQDENPDVSNICIETIQNVLKNPTKFNFTNAMENLFSLNIINLPRIIHRNEKCQQISEFKFLKGILQYLPSENIKTIFNITGFLDKFISCMFLALEIEINEISLLEEYNLIDINETIDISSKLPWRKYKNISSPEVFVIIKDICSLISNTSVAEVIFNTVLEHLEKNSCNCNEAIIFLILMLSNCNQNENMKVFGNIDTVLKLLLEENRWHLVTQPEIKDYSKDENVKYYTEQTPGLYESAIEIRLKDIPINNYCDDDENLVTAVDAKFNVLHTCLILDAIGHYSLTLNNKFIAYIVKSLHKIMQKAGSKNPLVNSAGFFALNSIKDALNYEKLSDLIHAYLDYITFHINMLIKKEIECSSVLDILSTVLRCCTINEVFLMEDIIHTIIDENIKESNCDFTSIFKVFILFFDRIHKWNISDKSQPNLSIESEMIASNIFENWKLILERPKEEEIIEDEPEDNQNDNEMEIGNEEETKTSLPGHIQIIVKIMKTAMNFLADNKQILKILSLECLTKGIPLLSNYENELLPMVHLIWYPFVNRFKDNDPLVLARCFDLLEVLALYAKDFLRQRTLKDVLPFLCTFLKDSAKRSCNKLIRIPTQEHRLQMRLLEKYPNLIISLELQEREMDNILEAAILYIHKKQPTILQRRALQFFKEVAEYNFPAVFVKLTHYSKKDYYNSNSKIFLSSYQL